eukprot:2352772-Amphidinium_carterae.1
MERLVAAGYVHAFDDLEACSSFLGCLPVLSPLGLISKQVVAPDGSVRDKHRLILDCKASHVNALARQTQRILLPSIEDA